jgi:hypothetical protein
MRKSKFSETQIVEMLKDAECWFSTSRRGSEARAHVSRCVDGPC